MSQPWPAVSSRRARPPVWLVTFADLCLLLMAFFVLLLSFAEFDPERVNLIRKAMDAAFAVSKGKAQGDDASAAAQQQAEQLQRELDARLLQAEQAVRSALATEPGASGVRIRRERVRLLIELPGALPAADGKAQTAGADAQVFSTIAGLQSSFPGLIAVQMEDAGVKLLATRAAMLQERQQQLNALLEKDQLEGRAEIRRQGDSLVLALPEAGSFPSGRADLEPGFRSMLERIAGTLESWAGRITIEGHTDNLPVGSNERFRSNWDLSAARAGAVADFLLARGRIDSSRISVSGYADTRPIQSNASAAGRARNRRIEISINLP
jgi:chemotaxis protein MotB